MDTKLSVKEIELMLYNSNIFKSSECITKLSTKFLEKYLQNINIFLYFVNK